MVGSHANKGDESLGRSTSVTEPPLCFDHPTTHTALEAYFPIRILVRSFRDRGRWWDPSLPRHLASSLLVIHVAFCCACLVAVGRCCGELSTFH